MKAIGAIAAVVLAVSGINAGAQTKADMALISCSDLSQMYAAEYAIIGAWMSGYYNAKRNNTVIDIKQLAENTRKVTETCRANPNLTVMKAIEQLSSAQN